MKELKIYRDEIDKIDKKMAILFNKRMKCIESVREYKRKNHLETYDKNREYYVIEQNIVCIDYRYRKYYIDFINNLMEISKKYQNK